MFDQALDFFGTDWLAMVLMLISLYLLGKKKRAGFVYGVGANISWLIFGILVGSLANVVANIVFVIMNALGYIRWRSDDGPS